MATLSNLIIKSEPNPIEPVFYPEVTDGSRRPYAIPMFHNRRSIYNNWLNENPSDPFQRVYSYMNNQGSAESMFWTGLGGNSRGNSYNQEMTWEHGGLVWAKNGTHGAYRRWTEYNYSSYGGEVSIGAHVLFLRNFHPTTSQSLTNIACAFSCGTNNATNGAGMSLLVPNTNRYSTTTSLSHTQLSTYTSNTSNWTTQPTITIAPQTTVALIMGSADYYYTNSYNWNEHWYHNIVYNLQAWSNNWIQPDLRLTMAAESINASGVTNSALTQQYQSQFVWNWAATQYGDR